MSTLALGRLPWDHDTIPPPEERVRGYAEEVGVRWPLAMPDGALKLGCNSCDPGQLLRHPNGPVTYCSECPVTRARRLRRRVACRG